MINLTLIDNVWMERKNPNITQEEKNILNDLDENNKNIRQNTMNNIKGRSLVLANNTDAQVAQELYDQHKLENSVLISVDIDIDLRSGIINCRLNNEHKQIRF